MCPECSNCIIALVIFTSKKDQSLQRVYRAPEWMATHCDENCFDFKDSINSNNSIAQWHLRQIIKIWPYEATRQYKGNFVKQKMSKFWKGLLFGPAFAWQRSTFYLLCSVWTARLGEGCEKNSSDSANYFTLPHGLWTMDNSLSNFKASTILKPPESFRIEYEDLWNHEAMDLQLEWNSLASEEGRSTSHMYSL